MGSVQMAAITTRFPRILIESQRLNRYSTCRMMSGSAAVGTPGEGAGKVVAQEVPLEMQEVPWEKDRLPKRNNSLDKNNKGKLKNINRNRKKLQMQETIKSKRSTSISINIY